MIDIHSHVLPDVTGDDGSRSIDMSLQMLRMAAHAGTKIIVCTPHVNRHGIVPSWSEITSKVVLLQELVIKEQIPIQLYSGAEIELNYDALSFLSGSKNKEYCLANTAYVLCELTEQSQPDQVEQLLFEVMLRGYTPILAHPERYIRIMKQPERILKWMHRGILTQCNAGSFTGQFGELAKKQAKDLLRNRMVIFLGSDMHRTDWRTPEMENGLLMIQKLGGHWQKCETNAKRMIQGKYLYPPLPDVWKPYRKGFFSKLFNR